jgi:hypothetical protein
MANFRVDSSLSIAVIEPPHPPSPSPPKYRRRRGGKTRRMVLVSCVLVAPERLRVPLLSSSPSPRYSEEKGLGDEEPRTGQTITSHHNASLGQARIEPRSTRYKLGKRTRVLVEH